jgi:NADPH2:quinone reductase
MKAVLCKAWGPPETLALEECPALAAEPGEVVVSVAAAGVNFPDTLIIQNKYQHKPPLPFSPGSEVAGVVKAVGAAVTGWRAGDRVIAQTTYGGFAEEVLAEPEQLIAMPAGMDFSSAATLGLAYGTSYYGLIERGRLRAGETLLVLGASGGVGIAAIEIGKILGAKVIACASSDAKLALCREHGADETINYATEDLRARVKAITGGKGVDVVYDPVGGRYTEPALRDMAWGGRLLVVGFAAGDIPKLALNLPLIKGCSVVGVWWGAFAKRDWAQHQANIAQLGRWFAEGKIRPHIWAAYPLERAADALNALARREVTGKVVLVTGK